MHRNRVWPSGRPVTHSRRRPPTWMIASVFGAVILTVAIVCAWMAS